MKKTLFIAALIATLVGCKSKTADNTATTITTPAPTTPKMDTPKTTVAAAPLVKGDTLCFQYYFKKDVSMVKLIIAGDAVTGDYHWHPYEKDGGHGTLKGKKTGNLINATWDYMIEGSNQSQEVIFKLEGDKLLEGEGELTEKGAILVLKDPSKVKFTNIYKKTDCAKVKFDSK